MADLSDVLDALDLAAARSEGVLPEASTAELFDRAKQIRTRNGFLGESLVVAFAGGTGCGKSSIINALMGDDVVQTGIVRPTTQHATAIHAGSAFTDLAPLLEALDVEETIRHDSAGEVILVDLPDFDSTAEAHRHVVEHVLPRVDAVVWVLDPEKYADPVLHHGFLRQLVLYEPQFVFALNQSDRILGEVDEVLSSLAAHLADDGFVSPIIVATVAVATDSMPRDVDALTSVIEERLDAKSTALRKIALDLRRIANEGWLACVAVDRRNMGERSIHRVALAAASFVWLGVTAYELYDRVAGHEEG